MGNMEYFVSERGFDLTDRKKDRYLIRLQIHHNGIFVCILIDLTTINVFSVGQALQLCFRMHLFFCADCWSHVLQKIYSICQLCSAQMLHCLCVGEVSKWSLSGDPVLMKFGLICAYPKEKWNISPSLLQHVLLYIPYTTNKVFIADSRLQINKRKNHCT